MDLSACADATGGRRGECPSCWHGARLSHLGTTGADTRLASRNASPDGARLSSHHTGSAARESLRRTADQHCGAARFFYAWKWTVAPRCRKNSGDAAGLVDVAAAACGAVVRTFSEVELPDSWTADMANDSFFWDCANAGGRRPLGVHATAGCNRRAVRAHGWKFARRRDVPVLAGVVGGKTRDDNPGRRSRRLAVRRVPRREDLADRWRRSVWRISRTGTEKRDRSWRRSGIAVFVVTWISED